MFIGARVIGCSMAAAITLVVGAGASLAQSAPSEPDVSTPVATYAPGRVLVHYAPSTERSDQQAAEHAAGASRIGAIGALGVTVLQVPDGAEERVIAALSESGMADYAERDGHIEATATPNDAMWGQEWGPAKIGMPVAWDTTTGSSSTVIAVLDSGVDFSHPDLQNRFVGGYDFVNNDTVAADDYGHGTKAAGVAGAASNNGIGIASLCWTCSLMPVKVLDAAGSGSYSALINAITWATDHGADVISMSVVGSTASTALQSAVQYARNHGVVVVGGAGNAGNSTPTYPASYPEVLSVAGSTSSDTLYSWSSYGSWVDVAAPGCTTSTVLGGSYGSFCGTSSATPVVSGLVGLLKSAAPNASVSEIEQAVTSSAVRIGTQVAYGRVDGAAAMGLLTGGAQPAPSPTASPTPAPTPSSSPAPAPSPTASTKTTTYSGSLSGKADKSYAVATGSGTLQATLTFTKASALTLQLLDASGALTAQATGGSPLQLAATVTGGSYTLVVSGQRASYTLSVTAPSP